MELLKAGLGLVNAKGVQYGDEVQQDPKGLEKSSGHSHLQEGLQADMQQLHRNDSAECGWAMVW